MEPEEKGSRSSSEILSTDSSESEDDFSISVSVSSLQQQRERWLRSSPEVDGSDDVSSDTVSSTTVSSTTVRGSTREADTWRLSMRGGAVDMSRAASEDVPSVEKMRACQRLSSIVSFLDGLKAGWGLRFAGVSAPGLEDVLI